eukprot:TRINITY_DN904_c0_g1_i10.p1 TRINITY_DN904_c0_g1~~TRINITY_DN904_c0_g1_i10.p1  ORF type:complete len:3001 (+),score=270.61 TRINITY_DN904_c0_g1_i10:136-9003(+)
MLSNQLNALQLQFQQVKEQQINQSRSWRVEFQSVQESQNKQFQAIYEQQDQQRHVWQNTFQNNQNQQIDSIASSFRSMQESWVQKQDERSKSLEVSMESRMQGLLQGFMKDLSGVLQQSGPNVMKQPVIVETFNNNSGFGDAFGGSSSPAAPESPSGSVHHSLSSKETLNLDSSSIKDDPKPPALGKPSRLPKPGLRELGDELSEQKFLGEQELLSHLPKRSVSELSDELSKHKFVEEQRPSSESHVAHEDSSFFATTDPLGSISISREDMLTELRRRQIFLTNPPMDVLVRVYKHFHRKSFQRANQATQLGKLLQPPSLAFIAAGKRSSSEVRKPVDPRHLLQSPSKDEVYRMLVQILLLRRESESYHTVAEYVPKELRYQFVACHTGEVNFEASDEELFAQLVVFAQLETHVLLDRIRKLRLLAPTKSTPYVHGRLMMLVRLMMELLSRRSQQLTNDDISEAWKKIWSSGPVASLIRREFTDSVWNHLKKTHGIFFINTLLAAIVDQHGESFFVKKDEQKPGLKDSKSESVSSFEKNNRKSGKNDSVFSKSSKPNQKKGDDFNNNNVEQSGKKRDSKQTSAVTSPTGKYCYICRTTAHSRDDADCKKKQRCMRCGKDHRTESCTRSELFCHNCEQTGHRYPHCTNASKYSGSALVVHSSSQRVGFHLYGQPDCVIPLEQVPSWLKPNVSQATLDSIRFCDSVFVGPVSMVALLDSGANLTLIKERALRRAIAAGVRIIQTSHQAKLSGINGGSQLLDQSVLVPINCGVDQSKVYYFLMFVCPDVTPMLREDVDILVSFQDQCVYDGHGPFQMRLSALDAGTEINDGDDAFNLLAENSSISSKTFNTNDEFVLMAKRSNFKKKKRIKSKLKRGTAGPDEGPEWEKVNPNRRIHAFHGNNLPASLEATKVSNHRLHQVYRSAKESYSVDRLEKEVPFVVDEFVPFEEEFGSFGCESMPAHSKIQECHDEFIPFEEEFGSFGCESMPAHSKIQECHDEFIPFEEEFGSFGCEGMPVHSTIQESHAGERSVPFEEEFGSFGCDMEISNHQTVKGTQPLESISTFEPTVQPWDQKLVPTEETVDQSREPVLEEKGEPLQFTSEQLREERLESPSSNIPEISIPEWPRWKQLKSYVPELDLNLALKKIESTEPEDIVGRYLSLRRAAIVENISKYLIGFRSVVEDFPSEGYGLHHHLLRFLMWPLLLNTPSEDDMARLYVLRERIRSWDRSVFCLFSLATVDEIPVDKLCDKFRAATDLISKTAKELGFKSPNDVVPWIAYLWKCEELTREVFLAGEVISKVLMRKFSTNSCDGEEPDNGNHHKKHISEWAVWEVPDDFQATVESVIAASEMLLRDGDWFSMDTDISSLPTWLYSVNRYVSLQVSQDVELWEYEGHVRNTASLYDNLFHSHPREVFVEVFGDDNNFRSLEPEIIYKFRVETSKNLTLMPAYAKLGHHDWNLLANMWHPDHWDGLVRLLIHKDFPERYQEILAAIRNHRGPLIQKYRFRPKSFDLLVTNAEGVNLNYAATSSVSPEVVGWYVGSSSSSSEELEEVLTEDTVMRIKQLRTPMTIMGYQHLRRRYKFRNDPDWRDDQGRTGLEVCHAMGYKFRRGNMHPQHWEKVTRLFHSYLEKPEGCAESDVLEFELSLNHRERMGFYLWLTRQAINAYKGDTPSSHLDKVRDTINKRVRARPITFYTNEGEVAVSYGSEIDTRAIPLMTLDPRRELFMNAMDEFDLPVFQFRYGQKFLNFAETNKRWHYDLLTKGGTNLDDPIVLCEDAYEAYWKPARSLPLELILRHSLEGHFVWQSNNDELELVNGEEYVSRGSLKTEACTTPEVKELIDPIQSEMPEGQDGMDTDDELVSPASDDDEISVDEDGRSDNMVNGHVLLCFGGIYEPQLSEPIPPDREAFKVTVAEEMKDSSLHTKVRDIVYKERDLFVPNGKPTNAAECKVTWKEDAKTLSKPRARPLNKADSIVMHDYFTKLLEEGVIRRSDSSCVHLVRSPKLRPVMDLRKVNENTVRDNHPLPRIADCFECLQKAKYMAVMDLTKSYHQVPMHPDSIKYTSFVLPFGQFEWVRMCFGLMNAPSVFQRMMNEILGDLLYKACISYIDDVIVFGETEDEFASNLAAVLERLNAANLKLNADKCCFLAREAKFLGFIVRDGKKTMDQTRLQGIKDLCAPRTMKQLRSLIGLISFFRDFWSEYHKWVNPLEKATKGGKTKIEWNETLQQSFNAIQSFLLSDEAPFLKLPDPEKPFHLETDASDYGVGGALFQCDEHDTMLPVLYIAKSLTDTQSRWCITEKEAYAIVFCLLKTQQYVLGSHITVETDHNNLRWMKNSVSAKIQRWVTLLAPFNYSILFKPGEENVLADGLSRLPLKDDVNCLSETTIALADGDEHTVRNGETFISSDDVMKVKKVLGCVLLNQAQDEVIVAPKLHVNAMKLPLSVLEELQEDQNSATPVDKFWIKDKACHNIEVHGVKLWCRKSTTKDWANIIVPYQSEYRTWYLKMAHHSATIAHSGSKKMVESILDQGIYWKDMRKDIKDHIRQCPVCQAVKAPHGPVPQGNMSHNGSTEPLERWNIDFLGPVLESVQGYKYILVMTDTVSRMTELAPLRVATGESAAVALYNSVICRYSTPNMVMSDRGPHFYNKVCKELSELLGFHWHFSIRYHPQSNGWAERRVGLVSVAIASLVDAQGDGWCKVLPTVMASLNQTFCSAIKTSPYQLVYGFPPRLPAPTGQFDEEVFTTREVETKVDEGTVMERALNMRKRLDEALAHEEKYLERIHKYATSLNKSEEFEVGDSVLERLFLRPHKFARRFVGPCVITKKESAVSYWVKSILPGSVPRKTHIVDLLRYDRGDRSQQDLLQEAQTNISYYPEAIRDDRIEEDGSRSMLVKWTAFDESENTWEPEENLKHLHICTSRTSCEVVYTREMTEISPLMVRPFRPVEAVVSKTEQYKGRI